VGIEPGTASPIVVSGEALLQTETCAAFGILLGRRNRFHIDGTPQMPDVAARGVGLVVATPSPVLVSPA
jgi:hypothetical protein